MLQCMLYILSIISCSVTSRLIKILRMHSNSRKNILNSLLIAPGIVLSPASCVRNKSNREAEELLKFFRFRHVLRNFPEYIVIIPAVDETYILALFPESPYNQFNRNDFPEITDVHGS